MERMLQECYHSVKKMLRFMIASEKYINSASIKNFNEA